MAGEHMEREQLTVMRADIGCVHMGGFTLCVRVNEYNTQAHVRSFVFRLCYAGVFTLGPHRCVHTCGYVCVVGVRVVCASNECIKWVYVYLCIVCVRSCACKWSCAH